MHNRTMILAMLVLLGGVMGVVVSGMHTPGGSGGKGVKKAGVEAKKGATVTELPVPSMPAGGGGAGHGRPVMMEKAPEPVVPAVVPVSGVGNSVGMAQPEARKSLIPGPEDAGQASSEGRQ